eukprot:TRINITY_DN12263_c0_g1_i2.p1 TRINITY_DN12263_c0_g1~~TRINITY_DN12263_c0_g1_i2.p1  ORF type:complete len:158 (+),score=26.50 TRINITY_DN12263_c0_g1_i2:104-577(+)
MQGTAIGSMLGFNELDARPSFMEGNMIILRSPRMRSNTNKDMARVAIMNTAQKRLNDGSSSPLAIRINTANHLNGLTTQIAALSRAAGLPNVRSANLQTSEKPKEEQKRAESDDDADIGDEGDNISDRISLGRRALAQQMASLSYQMKEKHRSKFLE